MSARTSLLAISALASGIAGFVGVGCGGYCSFDGEREPSVPLDVGVDVDLHAVVRLDELVGNRYYEQLAVGQGGTIVAWGVVESGNDSTPFVEMSSLDGADLRAIWIAGRIDYASSLSWWVVGDAGTIASSDNSGATWNPIVLPGIDADLHALTGHSGRPVIVGDDVILVRRPDGTWTEPPTPPGGWGSLRGIGTNDELIYAVGLGGVAWSTTDPSGEWTAQDVGTSVDLFDVHVESYASYGVDYIGSGVTIVGAAGTLLFYDSRGWRRPETDLSVDLIDLDGRCVLAADGEVYELGSGEVLTAFDSIPGAEAIDCQSQVTVGAGGLVMTAPASEGC
jgi:hypothetical protein